jgi:hypothetical protein
MVRTINYGSKFIFNGVRFSCLIYSKFRSWVLCSGFFLYEMVELLVDTKHMYASKIMK